MACRYYCFTCRNPTIFKPKVASAFFSSPDAPLCTNTHPVYHGAARYEQVNIPCQVEAYPEPHAFKWTFNNSGESIDISEVCACVCVCESGCAVSSGNTNTSHTRAMISVHPFLSVKIKKMKMKISYRIIDRRYRRVTLRYIFLNL